VDRPSYAVTVRLPMRTEYWHTETLPRPGTTISYCGEPYLVVSCERLGRSNYVLRLAEPEASGAGTAQPLPA
jgi:hypothetical protein